MLFGILFYSFKSNSIFQERRLNIEFQVLNEDKIQYSTFIHKLLRLQLLDKQKTEILMCTFHIVLMTYIKFQKLNLHLY